MATDPRIRSADGWMPSTDALPVHHHESPNHSKGYDYRDAVVLHIAQGSYKDSYEWLTSPVSKVSSHFIISNTGQIAQMVSVFDTAWGNGLVWDKVNKRWLTVAKPRRVVAPTWKRIRPGSDVNRCTISIERAGVWSDVPEPAEVASQLAVLRWIGWVFNLDYVPLSTLIGHCHINPVDKGFCPGPHVNYAAIAAEANNGRC